MSRCGMRCLANEAALPHLGAALIDEMPELDHTCDQGLCFPRLLEHLDGPLRGLWVRLEPARPFYFLRLQHVVRNSDFARTRLRAIAVRYAQAGKVGVAAIGWRGLSGSGRHRA